MRAKKTLILIIIAFLVSIMTVSADSNWWNSSMVNRYNITGLTATQGFDFPMLINGTNGYTINGVKNLIWYNPYHLTIDLGLGAPFQPIGSVSIYNSTGNIYAVANLTTEGSYDNPRGGLNNTPTRIYNSSIGGATGNKSIILALHFENNDSSSGWKDSSGWNNNGVVVTGTPIYVNNSVVGGGWDFDGTTIVNFTDNTVFDKNQSQNMTVMFWAYFDSVREENVFGKGNATDKYYFYTGGGAGGSIYIQAGLKSENKPCNVDIDNTVFTNSWHYFTWVINNNISTVYINGSRINNITDANCSLPILDSTNFQLGSGQAGYGLPFDGKIDEFIITHKALNETEINMTLANHRGSNNVIGNPTSDKYLGLTSIVSSILPTPAYGNNDLIGYCNASNFNESGGADVYFNYTFYVDGNINITGNATGPYNAGLRVNVGNVSNSSTVIGQSWILQCLGYNEYGTIIGNSSAVTIGSLAINVTIYDELNGSILLENISITSSSVEETFSNWTNTGRTTIPLVYPEIFTISFSGDNYATRIYSITVNGTETEGAILNARLLKKASSSNFTIYIQDSLNRVVPDTRLIIGKSYGGEWTTIIDTYTNDLGAAYIGLESGSSYLMTIISEGFPVKQFVQVFLIGNSPYTFRLTTTSEIIYTDVFNDVNYTYSPKNNTVSNDTVNFTINVLSLSNLLEWGSVTIPNGTIANNSDETLIVVGYSVNLSTYSGTTFTVTYCFKQSSFEQYCFQVDYFVEGRSASGGNLIDSLKTFRDLFSGGTSNGWLVLMAIFGVLIMCIVVAELSGNITVTTVTGFVGLIIFTYLGWINPLLSGFVCVIGLLMFFMSRQGGN